MPPEKKKKLAQESDDSEDAATSQKEKEETGTSSPASSRAKEAIKFDEYMEGGIPDSLLKGLGFSESGQPGADEGSEPEAEQSTSDSAYLDKGRAKFDSEEENDVAARDEDDDADDDDDDDEDYDERLPPKTVVKRKRGRPPGKTGSRGARQSSPNRQPVNKSAGSQSKAIIRGNIMYERTDTGEVIASLVKNGPDGNETAKTTPLKSGNYSKQARSGSASSTTVLNELPSNCPIDENNVEDILDRSIEETNTMRMILATLKDDLRRMGGGPNMTPYLKPVHVKKRIEIAERLLKVYCNYQTNINNISEMSRNPLSHVFPGNWTPVERTRSVGRAPRRGRGAGRAVAHVEPLAPDVGLQASLEVPLLSVVKQEPVNDAGAVSNDLWMSCEPGSDGEGAGPRGLARKSKKQSREKTSVDVQNN